MGVLRVCSHRLPRARQLIDLVHLLDLLEEVEGEIGLLQGGLELLEDLVLVWLDDLVDLWLILFWNVHFLKQAIAVVNLHQLLQHGVGLKGSMLILLLHAIQVGIYTKRY